MALACALLVGVAAAGQVPRFERVVIVVLENRSYSTVYKSSAMPYLNGLITENALATNYYANTHPSIGNYFMMTMGKIYTNNDGYTATIDQDNVVRRLLQSGKTWKAYAESLPSVGYIGGDRYPYIKHHTPLAYFSDVANSTVQRQNLVPLTYWFQDLTNGTLPAYSFITPNQYHNAHDCPQGMSTCSTADKLKAADNFLKATFGPLFSNPQSQGTLLLIAFDEASSDDKRNGGGHVVVVAVSPAVQAGTRAGEFYQHQSLLRTSLEALDVRSFPGAATTAPAMAGLFTASTPTGTTGCVLSTVAPSVTICSPQEGATTGTPVRVQAGTTAASAAVTLMQVYVDGMKQYETAGSSLDVALPMATGQRRVSVQARDAAGAWFKSTVYVTVQ